MRALALAFAFGVWALQHQASLPATTSLWLMAAMAVVLSLVAQPFLPRNTDGGAVGFFPGRCLGSTALLLAAWIAGFVWAAALAHVRLADRLDPAWENRDVVLTGVIASLPQPFDRGVRFDFEVEAAVPAEAVVPGRLSLAWYNGLSREEYQEVAPVRAGERWRFGVRLRRPHGMANPAGFDYEAWLLERGIRATGTVRAGRDPGPERLAVFVPRPANWVERLREQVRERFWDALPGQRYAGILAALAIGDQKAIEPREWEVFSRTGVSHLMSISGLHVTMFSGLAAAFLLMVWRRIPTLALRFASQKAAAIAGVLAALGYCLISGFAVPAQRTLYMVGVVALALVCGRLTSPTRVLAAALVLVLVLDPWAVLSAGFWLSFGAVAVIFLAGTGFTSRPHWLSQWAVMQWAVTVGLVPILLILFQQVSLVSPLSNAIAIPVVSLVITPLALVGAVTPFDAPLHLAHQILEWLMIVLDALSKPDFAVWVQHRPVWWTLPLALFGTVWLLLPRGFPSRWLGGVLMLPMVAVSPTPLSQDGASLTVYDVGQGLAVLIRTRAHALLYDAGPAWGADADTGSRIIVPDLRARGVRALDALVVSHDDTDHSGGALAVQRAVSPAVLYSSLPAFDPIVQAAPYRIPCADGVRWNWDGISFEFLHPRMARYEDPAVSGNNLSCVLMVSGKDGRVLIAGDLEWRGEIEMLQMHAGRLKADVVVVPHHGSNTSSTDGFVRAVEPDVAIFTVGYLNRFGHPKASIVERYASVGARIVRSDLSGAIEIGMGGGSLAVVGHRDIAPRYWHGS